MFAELLALFSLGTGGYALRKKNKDFQKSNTINMSEVPSGYGPYNQRQLQMAQAIIDTKQQRNYDKSMDSSSNVVNKNTKESTAFYSDLAGIEFSKEEFVHNNMVPFFGSRIKQNMNPNVNQSLMENYTGQGDTYQNKQEVTSMFDTTQNMTYVNGTPSTSDFVQSRMQTSKIHNNVMPVPQVRVGPGIGLGYTDCPRGGFQQFEVQDIARSSHKTVDELRVATKPKISYSTPVIAGQLGKTRGALPSVTQNDKFRYHDNCPTDMVPTTALAGREADTGCIYVKQTYRGYDDDAYIAPANSAVKNGVYEQGESTREVDECTVLASATQPINATMAHQAVQYMDDYGKKSYDLPYTNKEFVVNSVSHAGAFSSAVKSFMAPLQDLLKPTKAEFFIQNPRPNGVMVPQMPNKLQIGSLDPMRVTLKETNIHDSEARNLATGHVKGTVQNSDVSRTTRKETGIHDGHEGFLDPHIRCVVVYDPREVAKRTKRETLDSEGFVTNMSSGHVKGTVKPSDQYRVTVKQTTIDLDWKGGVGGQSNRGLPNETYDLKLTNKETCVDGYMGNFHDPNRPGAYVSTENYAKPTSKQFLVDNENVGGSLSCVLMPTVGLGERNANFNDVRERYMIESGPTMLPNGPKRSVDANDADHTRATDRSIAQYEPTNIGRIVSSGPMVTENANVRGKQEYFTESRMSPELICDQLKDNPFVVPSLVPSC